MCVAHLFRCGEHEWAADSRPPRLKPWGSRRFASHTAKAMGHPHPHGGPDGTPRLRLGLGLVIPLGKQQGIRR